jgi:hypothetical protein
MATFCTTNRAWHPKRTPRPASTPGLRACLVNGCPRIMIGAASSSAMRALLRAITQCAPSSSQGLFPKYASQPSYTCCRTTLPYRAMVTMPRTSCYATNRAIARAREAGEATTLAPGTGHMVDCSALVSSIGVSGVLACLRLGVPHAMAISWTLAGSTLARRSCFVCCLSTFYSPMLRPCGSCEGSLHASERARLMRAY